MILPGDIVEEFVGHGLISVQPKFDKNQLRPFGLRVHLDKDCLKPISGQTVDLAKSSDLDVQYEEITIQQDGHALAPGEFLLASTIERIRVDPRLICKIDGRSTLARLGIMVHSGSNIIDGNHLEHRSIVLEIKNMSNMHVVLPYGIGIGMVTFERVVGEASLRFEQNQYAGQDGVTPPNLGFNPEEYAGICEKDVD